jgi:hypothetical protein
MEAAYVVHSSSARLRLRVPARRHDRAWFTAVVSALRAQPGILTVGADAGRAVLTLHMQPAATSDARVDTPLARAGIHLAAGGQPRPARAAVKGPAVSARVKRSRSLPFGLRADRRTLALGVFLLLLTHQLLRSGWLVPGLALVWLLWESLPTLRGGLKGRADGSSAAPVLRRRTGS